MASPPHRENLPDPAYNISGFGVVRSGHLLYVTQDFGRGMTTYSAEKSEQLIARNIVDARHRSRLVRLRELDGTSARDAACQMAGENPIKTHVSREMKQSTYLVRYTSQDPETLPLAQLQTLAFILSLSAAATARQKPIPNGVYWVALMFY